MQSLKATLALVLVGALVSACTPLSQASLDSFKEIFQSGLKVDESKLSPNVAYMRVVSPGGEVVMGRGFNDKGRETWYTAGGQVLTMVNGIVVNSVDFPANVDELLLDPAGQRLALVAKTEPVTYRKFIDRLPEHSNEVTAYKLKRDGTARIKSWGLEFNTIRLKEVVVSSNSRNPMPGNTYWLTADSGYVVQSKQWLAPDYAIYMQPRTPSAFAKVIHLPEEESVPNPEATTLIVSEPTRLNVLLRSFPLPVGSYAPATAWLSRSAMPAQQTLKSQVLFDLDIALKNKKATAVELEHIQQLRTSVADMPVTGRVPLTSVNARWLQANPLKDPMLNGGDRVYRLLQRPDHATVIGGLRDEPCNVPVDPEQTVLKAVSACLPKPGPFATLPDTVYRIDADGRVSPLDIALWNRGPELAVPPGSRIWMPIPNLAQLSGNPTVDAEIAQWLATQVVVGHIEAKAP